MDSALTALVATIEANLREKLSAEIRAELVAEIAADRERLLQDDVPIARSEAARQLGISVDALDDLRRKDKRFPCPFEIVTNRPSWMLRDIWAYRELHRKAPR